MKTLSDSHKLDLYERIFENAPDATIVFDTDRRVLVSNRAAQQLPDELVTRLFAGDTPYALELALFRDEMASRGRAHAELRIAGRSVAFDGLAHGAHSVVTIRDVTESRRVEAELRSLQRVESVGHLTASVVHDFNNLLTPIACMSACLASDLQDDRAAREMARDICDAAERAAALARQVLRFVRREPARVEAVSLTAVVRDLQPLIERVAGVGVEVEVALAPNVGLAVLDRERLEHVLLNLVANARDAMPSGGRLTLSTGNISFEEQEASAIEGAASGAYVVLRVTDTGIGMTTEVRERVFERFFTTKGEDHGTGLGLSSAQRFMAQSHGCIAVRSEPGLGTTMSLYFPRIERTGVSPVAGSTVDVRGGTETLLVVDDEDLVRSSMRVALQGRGYRVLEAASADEALVVAETHSGPIHLVLVDVAMPKMGGVELARRLKMRRSSQVLFISGHTERMLERQGLLVDGSALLLKAFTPSELLLRVRELLDKGSRQEGERL